MTREHPTFFLSLLVAVVCASDLVSAQEVTDVPRVGAIAVPLATSPRLAQMFGRTTSGQAEFASLPPILDTRLFPRRDDYAWEGGVAGVALGILLGGVWYASEISKTGDVRLSDRFLWSAMGMAVTVPVGLIIGGAIPKGR